jgi:hypothetical protein
VTTTTNGNYTFNVSPTIQTAYQSHWRTADSQTAAVNVAPRVPSGQVGAGYVAGLSRTVIVRR